jgi:FtsP/CotA-like multicopper oxidase with cupredoxin domain
MGTWKSLTALPPFSVDTMLLLTDGGVMCHAFGTSNWYKLVPDDFGGYVNGSWQPLAPMPANAPPNQNGPANAPLYYASAVLRDGRVFVAGGEYNVNYAASVDLVAVQIYDPVADSWTVVPNPPGWANIGDAPTCVLPDGRVLLGDIMSPRTVIFDPDTYIWFPGGNKQDPSSEETWTLLPNQTVLVPDVTAHARVEKYVIAANQWVSDAEVPAGADLVLDVPGISIEIGPAVLMPNGKVFAAGASGHTAVYTPGPDALTPGSWAAGPDFPPDANGNPMRAFDAPACLLPNGNVLCLAGPVITAGPDAGWAGLPVNFFEYDGAVLKQVEGPPSAAGMLTFSCRFLPLPNGQVIFSSYTNDVEVYRPDGAADARSKPTIVKCPAHLGAGATYTLEGKQLNGLSQAACYGDDAQMATNYPLVRVRNLASNRVAYCRTHDHSTMAVATGDAVHSTRFDVPTGIEHGPSELVVVANGIPSDPFPVTVSHRYARLLFTAPLRRLTVERLDRLPAGAPAEVRVRMCNAKIPLHPELEPTELWTYDGEYPGKAFVVRRKQEVAVEWVNEIEGTLPVDVVSCGPAPRETNLADAQNEPGKDDGGLAATPSTPAVPGTNMVDHRGHCLPAWTVVHLHGGLTPSDSDGWTENAFLPRSVQGGSQRTVYGNDQRATLLWYHDHAMAITRLNVYAGLAGAWIIRDDEEDKLDLPRDEYEIPLVIQDRNLETDGERLTGRLLHKVETDPAKTTPGTQTMEFFGPFTLVNGTIWPRCPVEPKPYRLRLLNGSNARTYQLFLIDEQGQVRNDLIRQVGTDGGLLGAAVPLDDVVYPPADGSPARKKGLVLSPAERADLIVDFQLAPDSKLRLVNVAPAPYDGAIAPDAGGGPIQPGAAAYHGRLPYPEVMRFDVAPGPVGKPLPLPAQLSTFPAYDLQEPKWQSATHRWLALNESQYDPVSGKLDVVFFNELMPVDDPAAPADFTITLPGEATARRFMNVPVMFADRISWVAEAGRPEIWHVINFTADAHPLHLHLVQFQLLARDRYHYQFQNGAGQLKDVTGNFAGGLLAPVPGGQEVPAVLYDGPDTVDPNEVGWKDTVRVNPNGMLTLAVIFDGFTGRYMYHCHILEHEDMAMMRPFIVMPREARAFMGGMGGMGGMDGM